MFADHDVKPGRLRIALVRALKPRRNWWSGAGRTAAFRFQGSDIRHLVSGRSDCSDACPPRCSIVSAESAASRPTRTRSLHEPPPRRSGYVTGPDCTDSQADSAGSIPVTNSKGKAQVRTTVPSLGLVGPGRFRRLCHWPAISLLGTGAPTRPSLSSSPRSQSGWTCESIASVIL
jgi:hypothetical protein